MSKINKVAEITVYFWIMKVFATTLGETAGDFLSMTCNLGYWVGLAITMGFFILILMAQLISKRFNSFIYWTVIVATTTVGTEISDLMDRTLGLGYMAGSLILFLGLAATLAIWFYKERNLEVYPIYEKSQEILYWVAILFSNSLGTALGDFLSDNLQLNYTGGAIVCAGIIFLVILLHYFSRINQVVLFWIAFIFTRPFGATFGDLLTKPIAKGGLNIARGEASLVTAFLLVSVLIYSSWKTKQKVAKLVP